MTDLVDGWKNLFKGEQLTGQQPMWVIGSAVLAVFLISRG